MAWYKRLRNLLSSDRVSKEIDQVTGPLLGAPPPWFVIIRQTQVGKRLGKCVAPA